MKNIQIAIDGPAAAGKSTVAKIIASKLNYVYVDTGAMYRCVAYLAIKNNTNLDDTNEVNSILKDLKIELLPNNQVLVNGEDVTFEIRLGDVTSLVSQVASIKEVRTKLVEMQQFICQTCNVVMDGRDIGTTVLPEAQVKIYQIASSYARGLRRHNENLSKGIESNLEDIIEEINQRDYLDMNRDISPLKKADDAIEIDTSNYTIEESVQAILDVIKERGIIND